MMLSSDMMNGLFEGGGSLLLLLNIRQLLRDKKIAGVHWGPVVFWTAWGFWNLFYYPSLHQWYSFYGGCGVVSVNAVWLALLLYYRQKEMRL